MRRYMWANLVQSDYSLQDPENKLFSSYFGFYLIDSYQITDHYFHIWHYININNRVSVPQDRCTLIIEGGFSR